MVDKTLTADLNDVLDRAVKRSDRIGYSDACVSALAADGWEKAFCRLYRVRTFTPIPAEETLSEALTEWLGSTGPEAAEAIEARLGEPVAVFRAADEKTLIDRLSSCSGGVGAFYFTEDVFFVAFETHVLAFIMGNFE